MALIENTSWATKELALAYISGVNALSDAVLDCGQISVMAADPELKEDGQWHVVVTSSDDDYWGEEEEAINAD